MMVIESGWLKTVGSLVNDCCLAIMILVMVAMVAVGAWLLKRTAKQPDVNSQKQ